MANQLIFLDTEFTAFHHPQLISIGLVATTGEEFYAETPYAWADCSEFVRDVVVPLLGKDPQALCSCDVLRMRLYDWLKIVRERDEITICHDSEFDRTLFLQIFSDQQPAFVRFRNIGSRNINELLRYEFHVKNALPEHHALNDALAMRYAFRERVPVCLG